MNSNAAILSVCFALVGVVPAGAVSTNGTASATAPQPSMLTMGGNVTTPRRKASLPFNGTSLPVPPMQHSRWQIPQPQLPTNYLSATRLLFEQGLADPRDCDYRTIEVGTGDVWAGDGGVVETHGWILPGKQKQHFAICWNGLVYPVVSAGTKADLEADVTGMVTNGMVTWRSVIPEGLAVSPQSMLGIKGCLLLRLGRIDLATRYWQAQMQRGQDFQNAMWSRGRPAAAPATNSEIKLPAADPYVAWATEWSWAMFDRTICAHMRGDEALALATARQLAGVQPEIEAECDQRGFQRQPYYDNQRRDQKQPYLNFLDQLPLLLADLERRAKEGSRVTVIESGLQNITNQTERITALIHDLDLVQARQWSQPGWVNLPEDPIVSALIQEGDPAVEPLFDCLDNDKRLTRSVGFGRDFSTGRTVIPVSSAANVALQSILQAGFSGGAKEMRAYWDKYKNLKLEDRWYAILDDDQAGSRWGEAAARIMQPVNVTSYPGGLSMVKTVPTNATVPLRGQILRSKLNPSVSELMSRRALEFPKDNPNAYDISAACQMGLYLAAWDAQAAGPVVTTLSKRCRTVMEHSGQNLGGLLAKLSQARAKADDPAAFEDYAAWLPTTSPTDMGYSISDNLVPLKQFPTNPVLEATAEKMFGDTNSAWSRLPWPQNGSDNALSSDLVKVPAFRRLIIRELDRKEICGSVSWQLSPGVVNYSVTDLHMGGSFMYSFPKSNETTNGTSADLRWCDWTALSLANGKRIPPYNPFAPVEKRDKELESIKILLRQTSLD